MQSSEVIASLVEILEAEVERLGLGTSAWALGLTPGSLEEKLLLERMERLQQQLSHTIRKMLNI